jgi:hypothetical protein
MTMSAFDRSPVRVFEKALGGGLGRGNFGVVLSRTGGGKTSLLIGLALDKMLRGERVVHISTQETVEHLRAYYDQLLAAMIEMLQLDHRLERQLEVERRRHILVYDRDSFTLDKLRNSVAFLQEASGFSPDMVIMDGTPRFEHSEAWEMEGVAALARDWQAEVWTSATLHREGQQCDSRGVPLEVARFDAQLAVILMLASEAGRIRVRIAKDHGNAEVANVPLELDAHTLMLRWS